MTGNNDDLNAQFPSFNCAGLIAEFHYFLEPYPELQAIEKESVSLPLVYAYCERIEEYEELMRGLTMLYRTSHIDFQRALFCSWFSLCIARTMSLDSAKWYELFVAALFQDLGKYLVQVSVSEMHPMLKQVQSPDATSLGDSHPLISSSFLEQHLPDHQRVAELVLHHHVCADGSGYPANVVEENLGLDEKILVVCNEVAQRVDNLGSYEMIGACSHTLRIAASLSFRTVNNAAYFLLTHCLSRSGLTSAQLPDASAEQVLNKVRSFRDCLACVLMFSAELVRYDYDTKVRRLRAAVKGMVLFAAESGLLCDTAFHETQSFSQTELQELDAVFDALPEFMRQLEGHLLNISNSQKYPVDYSLHHRALAAVSKSLGKFENKRLSVFREHYGF